ncbi:MAG TPA: hypothetical protein VG757_10700 [Devosia sp.]|nr:hypothetical protein [Devosia sp.]
MLRRLASLAAAAAVALTLAACGAMDHNLTRMDEQVTPITVGDAAAIPADVLAAAMLRAGFTGDQILNRGVAVRDALATSGGAQVRTGDIVLALFSVHGNELYVTSRSRGTFHLAIS